MPSADNFRAPGQDGALWTSRTHADLTGRIRGLVILLDEHLTADQIRSVDELVDASEYGAALESLADWLSEKETPIADEDRQDFERLSAQIGNGERVMDALRLCPRR